MITKFGETQMQIGIDSFAAAYDDASIVVSPSDRLRNLVKQIEYADQVGLDVFEHETFLKPTLEQVCGAAFDFYKREQ